MYLLVGDFANWNWTLDEKQKTLWTQACYISLAAILGALVRIVVAQLFGEACANPGTIGWLSTGSPLCVTKDGQTQQQNGIVFADLPSNILGSFLMGFFQDYTVLGLAVPMAVAWLPPTHSFQRCILLHTAFKTGFCGSLTTFSSWNSEMVVMMFGTASTKSTHVISSILGYIIGMETSLGSFACGCSLARRLHRTINPTIALEGDAMQKKKVEGMHINHNLPDYERRYLHELDMSSCGGTSSMLDSSTNIEEYHLWSVSEDQLKYLTSWRTSTEHVRRVNHPLVPMLVEIETMILNEKCTHNVTTKLSKQLDDLARQEQWKIDDLYEWQISRCTDTQKRSLPSLMLSQQRSVSFYDNDYKRFLFGDIDTIGLWDGYKQQLKRSKWLKLPLAISLISIVMILLFIMVLSLRSNNAITVTNRTMAYAMLFAPVGALFRWHLSQYNIPQQQENNNNILAQYLGPSMNWFPYGTFIANFIGSMVSIICIAIEYNCTKNGYYYENDNYYDHTAPFIVIGSLRAIRIGFSGCLTTVSTFVAEIHNFMRTKTDHAYPYIFITLGTCSAAAIILYGFIVYII
jgi:fluoride ion exporter CrcB/FEX